MKLRTKLMFDMHVAKPEIRTRKLIEHQVEQDNISQVPLLKLTNHVYIPVHISDLTSSIKHLRISIIIIHTYSGLQQRTPPPCRRANLEFDTNGNAARVCRVLTFV